MGLPIWAGTADTQRVVGSDKHKGHCPPNGGQDMSGCNGDNSLVLIQCVQLVEYPERRIPSLVRLQSTDKALGATIDALYFSNRVGFKMIRSSTDREAVSTHNLLHVASHQVTDQQIQCGPEIVDGITDYSSDLEWDVFVDLHAVNILTGLRVLLFDKFVWAGFVESFDGRLEVRDVAFGPFDF